MQLQASTPGVDFYKNQFLEEYNDVMALNETNKEPVYYINPGFSGVGWQCTIEWCCYHKLDEDDVVIDANQVDPEVRTKAKAWLVQHIHSVQS
jgi:hypothetical protein